MSSIIKRVMKPAWLATLGHWVVTAHGGGSTYKLFNPEDLFPVYKAVSVVLTTRTFLPPLLTGHIHKLWLAPGHPGVAASLQHGRTCQSAHSCTREPYLALAEGTLCAVLDPGRPSEANHIHLVQAGFGDVIADGVGLTRIGDTAWAALILRKDTKFTLYLWASQGPAVNFSLLWGKEAMEMNKKEERQRGRTGLWFVYLELQNPCIFKESTQVPLDDGISFAMNGWLNSLRVLNNNSMEIKATSISLNSTMGTTPFSLGQRGKVKEV